MTGAYHEHRGRSPMTLLDVKPPEAPAAQDFMVKAAGVVRSFDTGKVIVHALRGVDLEVKRGEMVAIMGPSGCGKTTLLNCLSGLDQVDGGEVFIEGVALSSLSDT